MQITVHMPNGSKELVEVIRKLNLGLRRSHNRDGRQQKMWAVAVDGRIFKTSSSGYYRPIRPDEVPPAKLLADLR
jgi:hypothetical protein